jgi:Putative regulator of cell autolysis
MLRAITTPSRLFWILQISGWLALVPLFTGLNFAAGNSLEAAIFSGVVRQVTGFALTLGLREVYRRWSWDRPHWQLGFRALLLSGLAMAVDYAVLESLRHVAGVEFNIHVPLLLFGTSLGRVCIYAGWSALYLAAIHFLALRDRELSLARVEIAARDAELQVLRAQLNPHFLFNALHTIMAEADDDPARVKKITLGLSELLRFSLRQRDHVARFGDELEAIENYLRIEGLRFEEKLDWQIDVTPAAHEARVPTSLLLPLVENAIKHGQQTSQERLVLRLGADVREGRMEAFVENSGQWVERDPNSKRSTGVGLTNLRRRLALLCGPQGVLTITFPEGHVRMRVTVPVSNEAQEDLR